MSTCYPAGAIWPDPSVLLPPEGATEAELALFELHIELATQLAWTTFQQLTAYQVAICPVTVRPCGRAGAYGSYFIAPVDGPAGAPFWPSVQNGQWINILCGRDHYDCSCAFVDDLLLPGPVGAIESIYIDGELVDPSAYRVDNGNRLVRQDGKGWPLSQDFNRPAGAENTFTVTYYHGATSDMLVRYAVGILADEYLKSISGESCRLPAGVTNMVRLGMTFEMEKDLFETGITGIAEVDHVTARFNPYRHKMPSRVYSLDTAPPRQTTLPGYLGS